MTDPSTPPGPDAAQVRPGDAVVIDVDGVDQLIAVLGDRGYDTRGPVVAGGAVVPGAVAGVADLPAGHHDEQAPGHYRLRDEGDGELFGWAVGPGSWKAEYFPPPGALAGRTRPVAASPSPSPPPRPARRP